MTRLKTILVPFALIAVGLAVFWIGQATQREDPSSARKTRDISRDVAPPAPDKSLAPAFETLAENPTAEHARATLQDLKMSLAALPKAEALEQIRGFLASGRDHSTQLSFEIGKDGSLTEWPTFRTFLLDALLEIDPAAAAAIGREILASPTTADEWALALRNVARGEPGAGTAGFLRSKTEELITRPEWQAEPSIGYLNAFDVLVHIEATASTPLLSDLIQRKDRKDLAHAGFLTLDRLVQRQPADVLTRLASDLPLQQSRPEMVAQQFARADLRDPVQRDLVKTWLLDTTRTPVELRSFAGVFPNNNRFISNNLLTQESSYSGADIAAHDREVLQTISTWVEDPAFLSIRETLDQMISRLDEFVGMSESSSLPPVSPSPPE